MTRYWKAILGVILIYIFGCLSGAVSTSIFFHHRMLVFLRHPAPALSAALEKRLTGNLGLDANQKQQVHGYFLDNLQQRKELQKQIQPQIQALNEKTVQEVAAILHPDQTKLFNENVEKFRKRLAANAVNPNTENPSAPQIQPAAPATHSGAGSPP
jgi:DNA primase